MNQLVKSSALVMALITPFALAQSDAKKTPAAEVQHKVPELNRAQLDSWLAKPGSVVFIDLRRPDEISTIGSFPVYLNIQLSDLEKYLAYIPKERTIITVSNHAARALKAADILVDKGFKVAGAAGTQHYEEQGGTITRIVKPEPKPDANKTADNKK